MRTCRCIECGTIFETSSSRRLICYKDHYRTCKVCGKQFLVDSSKIHSNVQTCSEKCRRDAISQTEKSKEPRFRCTCSICGREFLSKEPSARVCNNDHEFTCQYCGKKFIVSHQQAISGTKTCSDKCRYLLAQSTYQFNFGKDKNPSGHRYLQEKMRNSMLSKYGVDNAFKSVELRERGRKTSLEKYGKPIFAQTDEYIKKTIETNRVRYGADWHAQTDEHKESLKKTCLERYGVDNFSKSSRHIIDKMHHPEYLDNWISFRNDPERFVESNFDHTPTMQEISSICGVRDSSVGWYLDQIDRKDVIRIGYSTMEDQVVEFLRTIVDENDIIRDTRKIITPYELDIYLPKYNFAIECNPTCTHNSSTGVFGPSDEPKPTSYHKMKSDMCEGKGIFLFHIFGYEWEHRRAVIESMISNILGHNTRRIYARQTEVREVSFSDSTVFLENNHRQGNSVSKIRLGLYHDNELVSLMTFSSMRSTIGAGKDTKGCYELSRFCNLIDTSVIGGASKLFKYFVDQYHPPRIRSFSDRAHTRGNLYQQLGFHEIRRSDASYVWVQVSTDVAYSRLNAQKRNIIKFLHDPDIDLKDTEKNIMESHGFVSVYDSGTICWEWNR